MCGIILRPAAIVSGPPSISYFIQFVKRKMKNFFLWYFCLKISLYHNCCHMSSFCYKKIRDYIVPNLCTQYHTVRLLLQSLCNSYKLTPSNIQYLHNSMTNNYHKFQKLVKNFTLSSINCNFFCNLHTLYFLSFIIYSLYHALAILSRLNPKIFQNFVTLFLALNCIADTCRN